MSLMTTNRDFITTFAVKQTSTGRWVRRDITRMLDRTGNFRGEWATCADADGVAAMCAANYRSVGKPGAHFTVVIIKRKAA